MKQKYYSTKRFGPISTGHRQWRDDGKCAYIHGYGRYVEVTFSCSELDDKGWVVSFGGLKDVRLWLESQWDHRLLISDQDPLLESIQHAKSIGLVDLNIMDSSKGHGPGIEQSCKFVYDYLDPLIRSNTSERCWVKSVRIWEHENNSAMLVIDD